LQKHIVDEMINMTKSKWYFKVLNFLMYFSFFWK